MSSEIIKNAVRFFLLLLMQVIVFNNINLYGYVQTFPYLLFIVLYPVNSSRYGLLLWSFLLGLSMDMFDNSGGIHAASCLILAYFRHNIFKVAFGLSYEYQTIKIQAVSLKDQVVFISISVFIHHFVLFLLEAFSFSLFGYAVLKVLFSGIFTIIFSVLIINLFKMSKK